MVISDLHKVTWKGIIFFEITPSWLIIDISSPLEISAVSGLLTQWSETRGPQKDPIHPANIRKN
jgi:hypothetical protein